MQIPLTPSNEAARLATLRALQILDTPPEERFDRITRIAQHVFGVPITMVSLVDADRQWFKSRQGVTTQETSRDISFCGHAILGDAPLVVEDAHTDPRFFDNPMVVGDPHIRFYAGLPLAGPDGSKLGALCLVDRRPRSLTPSDLQVLRDLGDLTEGQLAATELNAALAQVHAQETKLRDFLDSANDLIQSVTPAGRFAFVNRTWCKTLGYTAEEGEALSLLDVIHPDSHAECAEFMRRVLQGEPLTDLEITFVTKSGRPVIVSGNVNCLVENDVPVAVRGIFRDITARRQAEVELTELREELTHLLVHDLRNPLTVIDATLGLLLRPTDDRLSPERRLSYLTNAAHAARLLNDMISNLLDVACVEHGRLVAARLPLSPHDLLTAAADAVQTVAETRQVRVVVDASASGPAVIGDADLLRRVLGNLVGNALNYTPSGGLVRLQARATTTDVVFSVHDEGPGVPSKAVGRIFQKFAQLGGKDQRPGTGLGLYFCRLVIEAHGGTIWAEPRADRGTTFRFTVPQTPSGDS